MPMPDTEQDGPELRPFAAVVQEARKGVLHQELSEALAEVVAAARMHQKPGSVTLTLTIKPQEDGDSVLLADSVKKNVPKAASKPSVFFADDRGNLSRRHPRQQEFALREVAAGIVADADNLSTPRAAEAAIG
jgi:hypothetical protein